MADLSPALDEALAVIARCKETCVGSAWEVRERQVLRCGRTWSSRTPTAEQVDLVAAAMEMARRPCRPRECFANAQAVTLADRSGRVAYAEGYACIADLAMPIHHAWLVVDDDLVVDLTWSRSRRSAQPGIPRGYRRRIWGAFDAPASYRGITIPVQQVRRRLLETRCWTPLLDEAHPRRRRTCTST